MHQKSVTDGCTDGRTDGRHNQGYVKLAFNFKQYSVIFMQMPSLHLTWLQVSNHLTENGKTILDCAW